ncbi:divergent polysaccharide deacetylase family protein [Paraglaciecola aestuariivivens]
MRLALLTVLCSLFFKANAAQIALIIDDMGNNKKDAVAFALPAKVALAILPNKPLSTPFSSRAAAQKRDVILHMPMESLAGTNQEQHALLATMPPQQIIQTLKNALSTVPHAMGVNNHMGSRLTQLTMPMSITMEYLSQQGLFFVDSRTTKFSKAEHIAKQNGVLSTKRNVFLDHTPSLVEIDRQFHRLLRLAKKYGYAVGIAHPYPQTLAYLKQHLNNLEQHGIELVKLTELLSAGEAYANQAPKKPTDTTIL